MLSLPVTPPGPISAFSALFWAQETDSHGGISTPRALWLPTGSQRKEGERETEADSQHLRPIQLEGGLELEPPSSSEDSRAQRGKGTCPSSHSSQSSLPMWVGSLEGQQERCGLAAPHVLKSTSPCISRAPSPATPYSSTRTQTKPLPLF